MGVLTRYLLGRMTAALVLAVLLVAGMIWTLQVLRLGHHLLAGGAVPQLLLSLLLHSLPTLLAFALPTGLALAILFTLAQLGEAGELDAMRACGASPLRLARPAALLCLATAALALGAGRAEPPALAALQRTLQQAAARALVGGIQAGMFHALPDDTVLYAEGRQQDAPGRARLRGLLLARGPRRLVLAREGTLRVNGDALNLALHHGEVQLTGADNRLVRVRFREMEHTVPLGRILAPHLGFLTRNTTPRQAWAAALALGLLSTVLALGIRGRLRVALAGLAALALYLLLHAAARQMNGPTGQLLLAGVVSTGSVCWLVWSSRRRATA